jgi:hypothetical protein
MNPQNSIGILGKLSGLAFLWASENQTNPLSGERETLSVVGSDRENVGQ